MNIEARARSNILDKIIATIGYYDDGDLSYNEILTPEYVFSHPEIEWDAAGLIYVFVDRNGIHLEQNYSEDEVNMNMLEEMNNNNELYAAKFDDILRENMKNVLFDVDYSEPPDVLFRGKTEQEEADLVGNLPLQYIQRYYRDWDWDGEYTYINMNPTLTIDFVISHREIEPPSWFPFVEDVRTEILRLIVEDLSAWKIQHWFDDVAHWNPEFTRSFKHVQNSFEEIYNNANDILWDKILRTPLPPPDDGGL